MKRIKQQTGFTIVELLIATTIFSIVLMVILASFLQIGRMFYKGISVNNTQEAARTIVEDISNDVKLSSGFNPGGAIGTGRYFCLGLHRYTYNINHVPITSLDVSSPNPAAPKGVIVSTVAAGCPSPTAIAGTNSQQLLGPDMQLNDFGNNCGQAGGTCGIDCSTYVCVIRHVHIVFYGSDSTVFDTDISALKNTAGQPSLAATAPDARCSGNLLSTQFCAMADLNLTVAQRE